MNAEEIIHVSALRTPMYFGKIICIELATKRKTSLKCLEVRLVRARFLRLLRILSVKKVQFQFVACKYLVVCTQEH